MTGYVSFADLLRHHRLRQDLSQVKLSRQTGISQGYLTLLETGGRTRPRREIVEKLAQALELNDDEKRTFFAAAQYTPAPLGASPPKGIHPIHGAVEQLLALPPGSGKLPKAMDRLCRELLAAARQRKAPRRQLALLEGTALAGIGYFHLPREHNARLTAPVAVSSNLDGLAARIAVLLEMLGDGRLPVAKRIRLADELLSLADWRLSGQQPKHRQARRGK